MAAQHVGLALDNAWPVSLALYTKLKSEIAELHASIGLLLIAVDLLCEHALVSNPAR